MTLNANVVLSALAHESSSDGIAQIMRSSAMDYAFTLADSDSATYVSWTKAVESSVVSTTNYSLRSLTDERGTVVFTTLNLFMLRNTGEAGTVAIVYEEDGGAVTAPSSGSPLSPAPFSIQAQYTSGVVQAVFAALAPGDVYTVASPTGYTVQATTNTLAVRVLPVPGTPASYEIIAIGQGTIT